jgi:glycosyltransferase involved in cell wall biosynthesis
MMKKNILVSAYAISPNRGSEYGAAWNTILNLAGQHKLWVLYGMSDDHMGDTYSLKLYIENNPMPSVKFVEVKAGWLANTVNLLNKAGLGWFFYFAYYLWQWQALKAAQKIVQTVDIDVVHQLGPIGYREPGFLNRLNKPLVWGPVGGMKIMESRFIAMLPLKAKIKFIAKNYINWYQLAYSGRIKLAFSNADVIISATRSGQLSIKQRFGRESHYLPEQGITTSFFFDENKFNNLTRSVQFVWSGSLIERKNLKMCLDALAGVKHKNWMLHVLGDGPLRKILEKDSAAKGIAGNITFHGHLPREEAVRIMAAAHLHIITSIGEDNPAVIFEAMSNGVPTLTIGHCGMGDVICSRCGIKIQPDDYDRMVHKISAALFHLLNNTKILVDMAQATLVCAKEHTWDKRLKKLNTIYEEAITSHKIAYAINERALTAVKYA